MKIMFILLIAFSTITWGHQPVKTNLEDNFTSDSPYIINEPQISKAIFSELTGSDHFYQIQSNEPFDFYTGITQAKPDGCSLERTFSFQILDENLQEMSSYSGEDFEWWSWYESFGKKWYWVGPETGEEFLSTDVYPAGIYYIRVYNDENSGKYVLAVGDDERFTIGVIARTIAILPGINREHWGKPSKICQSQ